MRISGTNLPSNVVDEKPKERQRIDLHLQERVTFYWARASLAIWVFAKPQFLRGGLEYKTWKKRDIALIPLYRSVHALSTSGDGIPW